MVIFLGSRIEGRVRAATPNSQSGNISKMAVHFSANIDAHKPSTKAEATVVRADREAAAARVKPKRM
jgi:hypothetical protein